MKTRTMAGILIVALVALSVGVAATQYSNGDCDRLRDGSCLD